MMKTAVEVILRLASAAAQSPLAVASNRTRAPRPVQVEDHGLVAKKEHVQAIEAPQRHPRALLPPAPHAAPFTWQAELDRMEAMAHHVYEEMVYMRTRSDQMRQLSGSTRSRLFWVEVMMMVILLLMGMWQISYLKRYFQAKKVI